MEFERGLEFISPFCYNNYESSSENLKINHIFLQIKIIIKK